MNKTNPRKILENIIDTMEKTHSDEWEIDKLVVVLNYINELEKECIRLKEIAYNLTTATVCGDWKQIKNTAQYKLELAQQRIDRAIEYINNNKNKLYQGRNDFTCEIQYSDEVVKANELLDILRGKEDDN